MNKNTIGPTIKNTRKILQVKKTDSMKKENWSTHAPQPYQHGGWCVQLESDTQKCLKSSDLWLSDLTGGTTENNRDQYAEVHVSYSKKRLEMSFAKVSLCL